MTKMPVKINENNFTFSPGKHNELQKQSSRNLFQDLLQAVNVYI